MSELLLTPLAVLGADENGLGGGQGVCEEEAVSVIPAGAPGEAVVLLEQMKLCSGCCQGSVSGCLGCGLYLGYGCGVS